MVSRVAEAGCRHSLSLTALQRNRNLASTAAAPSRVSSFVPSHCSTRCFQHQPSAAQSVSRRAAVITASSSYPMPKQSSEEKRAAKPLADEVYEEEMQQFLDLELQSALDAPPRHYEIVFLVHEAQTGETPNIIGELKEKVADMRGKVWRVSDWGLRPLAYKIQKCSKAHYVLMNVEIAGDKIGELEKRLLKDERVIRHLVSKLEAAETVDYPSPVVYNERREGAEEDDEDDSDDEEYEDEEDEEVEEEEEEEEDGEDGEEVDEGVRRPSIVESARGRPV